MFSFKGAKEWASGFLGDGGAANQRPNLDVFLHEVSTENTEHLYFTRKVDEKFAMQETKPTYEQLSQHSITHEANRNIKVLKAFEVILQERMLAYERFLTGLSRISSTFEHLHDTEGTIRQAFDALFVYTEQELQQARQQTVLGDLRRQVSEVREDTERKLAEYGREVENLAKDVVASEKKLKKSKDSLGKILEAKAKMDVKDAAREQRKALEEESHYEFDQNGVKVKKSNGIGLFAGTMGGLDDKVQNIKADMRVEKRRELTDMMVKAEREVADDIRALLRAISNQDQMQLGLRRAYQHVDLRCKNTIRGVLSSLLDREEESAQAKLETVGKLSVAVRHLDVENDVSEFISQNVVDDVDGDGGSLVLSSQALNILEDIMPHHSSKKKKPILSGTVSTEEELGPDGQSRSRTTTFDAVQDRDSTMADQSVNEECTLHLTRLFYAGVGSADDESTQQRRKSILASSFGSYLKDSNLESNRSSLSFNTANDDGVSPSRSIDSLAGSPNVNLSLLSRAKSDENTNEIQRFAMPPSNAFQKLNNLPNMSPVHILDHCRNFMLHATLEEKASKNYMESVENSVCWLSDCVRSQFGRDTFATVLNQFRSRKVDVGDAYHALGAVLWQCLDHCADAVDIHTSKVIMMLSQTFYCMNAASPKANGKMKKAKKANSITLQTQLDLGDDADETDGAESDGIDGDDRYAEKGKGKDNDREESEIVGRGQGVRKYLKEMLTAHHIWKDGKYWEQVLWECAIEQLYSMPYESPWYDLSTPDRREAVRRVHNVVMSQVMAVEHSMLELGCTQELVREFVYRMCVIHQLSECQRQTLLLHLQSRSDEVTPRNVDEVESV